MGENLMWFFANVFEPLHNFQQVLPIDLERTAA
jgi:hypothetical protein